LFIFKPEFLKIFLDLQISFGAETRRAEGQWLEEQQKMVKLIIFRVGTRMPTISRREEAIFTTTKTFIKNKAPE
jgi:hypothetical protein